MNRQDRKANDEVRDDRSEVPLDFDAWADLSAKLLQRDRDSRLDILEEREIGTDTWTACEKHWTLYLAAELSAGRMDQARAYGLKCAAELERRSAEAAAAPATPPTAAGAPEHLSETAKATEMPLPGGGGKVLPFQSTPSAEFLASLAAPRSPRPHDPTAGLTEPLGTLLLSDLKNTLPFGKRKAQAAPDAVSWPRLTLQQYASLCAELSVAAQDETEILRRYHITGVAARKAVDREWQDRLATHADTQAEWQRLYSEFRDWLLHKPR